jgi:hypothetical protein
VFSLTDSRNTIVKWPKAPVKKIWPKITAEQIPRAASKLTVQDVPSLSVDQAQSLSRGVSVTTRIAKRELQTRLCGLLSAEQEQAELQSVEGKTSAQMSGDKDDVHKSASLAPSSSAYIQR